MNAQTDLTAAAAPGGGTVPTYGCTFGHYAQAGPWTDVRVLTWPDLAALLTRHEVGPKEGSCIVPAVFRGARRHKADAARISVAMLDSDAGATLAEIVDAVRRRGWAAAVTTTHSHLTSRAVARQGHWERFRAARPDLSDPAATFLREEKGCVPRVAADARVVAEMEGLVTFEHQPCPRFRIALPMLRPWSAAAYPDQDAANAAWRELVEALAAALGLAHDQACTDTSRLFYLPRRPAGGPVPEATVLEGELCDIFALPEAANARSHDQEGGGASDARRRRRTAGEATDFVDPETGVVTDLAAWVRQHGGSFEIVSALRARRPEVLTGKVAERAKHHIRCPNEAAHTQAGADAATFAVDASEARNKGFAVHCRHAHCDGRDRLLFLRQMLEQRWLSTADLTDPAFLAPDRPGRAEPEDPELTEHGVALAFAARHADRLRYCHTAGAWHVWTGTRWERDETRLAFTWARHLAADLNRDREFRTRAATGRAAFATAVERFARPTRRSPSPPRSGTGTRSCSAPRAAPSTSGRVLSGRRRAPTSSPASPPSHPPPSGARCGPPSWARRRARTANSSPSCSGGAATASRATPASTRCSSATGRAATARASS